MSGVFGRVFGKSKEQSQATALASLDKLNEVNRSADISTCVRCSYFVVFMCFSYDVVTKKLKVLVSLSLIQNKTLEMLEKKENLLVKKANLEVEKAKNFTKAKNKRGRIFPDYILQFHGVPLLLLTVTISRKKHMHTFFLSRQAAIQCLKRKRLYEQQIEQLGNFQLRIHDQMIMLEAAKATTETVDALRTGASAMKAMHKSTNIDDVDKTMDEINDNMENMRQIQDLLSAPMGAAADFDEDELEAELADLEGEELEAELLAPTTTAPSTAPVRVRVPTAQQSTRPSGQSSKAEDDELAALQAEMAM
ncbi:Charged multivesicular body protein 4b [Zea mays]|uniref:Charged multivesicular body protein 4b n=1 Tax=Zea mays TaxID=4577 RepID=A0A1D6P3C0_MAIZE|nr:Charged multivesicular body protein 4b [Zea mays]